MSGTITGGCLCGRIRFAARGEPINQRVCHCRLCQRAIGAAFNARLLYPREAVTIEGAVSWFPSSDALHRGFCAHCGTSLFSERRAAGRIGITTGALDDPSVFVAEDHIWTSSKQDWLSLPDDLPHYPENPPG